MLTINWNFKTFGRQANASSWEDLAYLLLFSDIIISGFHVKQVSNNEPNVWEHNLCYSSDYSASGLYIFSLIINKSSKYDTYLWDLGRLPEAGQSKKEKVF